MMTPQVVGTNGPTLATDTPTVQRKVQRVDRALRRATTVLGILWGGSWSAFRYGVEDVAMTATADLAMKSFDELVERHYRDVFAHAFRLTGSRPDAEDLTHDTFVRAFGAFSRFDGNHSRAWLRRITTNVHIDRTRRDRARPTSAMTEAVVARLRDLSPEPAEMVVADEFDPKVRDALNSLPDRLRWVILLADVEGYSHDEIAAMLGIKRGTVASRLHRGRAAMRSALKPPTTPGLQPVLI